MYTHYDLMLPLLKIMQCNNKVYHLNEAYNLLLIELKCSEEEKNETMEDGRNVIFYRLQWAKTYLKKAGLIKYTKRAHFNLSKNGTAKTTNAPPIKPSIKATLIPKSGPAVQETSPANVPFKTIVKSIFL